MDHLELGQSGEQIAVSFLKRRGYKILERNFQACLSGRQAGQLGEIDIIAQDFSSTPRLKRIFIKNVTLVFIEVKTKSDHNFGLPEEELTTAKKEKLQRAIQQYFRINHLDSPNWRLDLVAIDFCDNKIKPEIRHYQGLN
ncbi:MAG: YraN family protein [Patescibacteria group bacterium]|nr:YraN family protein [Patescibacteria group bacterium]MDD5121235.1 YraN family protein [Patescibacteria group bacterium]MDD5222212.1 YraN family protein [Patescibacteria group bacterium]MDD5395846.1 YraN family protein [Patescibacteria group bacterium]